MDMNRNRPPAGCQDLELWLSGVVNDAMRDATEAGLKNTIAARLVLSLGATWARGRGCMTDDEIAKALNVKVAESMPEVARALQALYNLGRGEALKGWLIRLYAVPAAIAAVDVSNRGVPERDAGYWAFSLGRDGCGQPEPIGTVERVLGGADTPRPLNELLAQLAALRVKDLGI